MSATPVGLVGSAGSGGMSADAGMTDSARKVTAVAARKTLDIEALSQERADDTVNRAFTHGLPGS